MNNWKNTNFHNQFRHIQIIQPNSNIDKHKKRGNKQHNTSQENHIKQQTLQKNRTHDEQIKYSNTILHNYLMKKKKARTKNIGITRPETGYCFLVHFPKLWISNRKGAVFLWLFFQDWFFFFFLQQTFCFIFQRTHFFFQLPLLILSKFRIFTTLYR